MSKNFYYLRLIIPCLGVYNFTSLWLLAKEASESTLQPLVPHWFDPWRYDNEPTILLFASVLLLLNKKPSDLVAAILSGYIFFQGLWIITFRIGWADWLYSWSGGWFLLFEPAMLLYMWDFQLIVSLVILSLSVFYLIQRRLPESFR